MLICCAMLIYNRLFLIQVFLCLIAIAAVSLLLHLPKLKSETPWKKQLPRIDVFGALLLVLTVTSLLFGLDRGSNVSWRSPFTIGPLSATIPLAIAFIIVETRFAIEPFTPGHIIFDRALCACYVNNFFLYANFTALTFYLPTFFQVSLYMTPARAGASLIPSAMSVVAGTVIGGAVMKKTGKFYWLAVLSSTIATAGLIPILVAPTLHNHPLVAIFTGSVISFIPQGITLTASLIAISKHSRSTLVCR